ncbi:MAG: DUF3524 domain-containing protein [Dehalococcoidia bacterium]|nr:DUF3524 domain-containing protein [Dehalococcoidia bacterium]
MARVLFVEPFYGGSHRAFTDGLVRASRHEVVLLTLPEGEWRRRMRRGAIEMAGEAAGLDGPFDLVIATDMLDVPLFLALTRGRFAGTPVMVYFHENQFTYPRIRGTKLNSWFGAINYHSALVADAVAFNSAFHLQEFLGALRTLAEEPNNWLVPGTIDAIAAKSAVLPVGLDLPEPERPTRAAEAVPVIAWTSRWEFDKSPDLFARTLRWLAEDGVPFEVMLLGDPGPNPHPALVELPAELGARVVHAGMAPTRERYLELLAGADIVVSTARHEFFGVGMVEAMHAGCVPLAPRALNYPALVPAALHDMCLFDSEPDFRAKLRALVEGPRPGAEPFRTAAAGYGWDVVGPQWDAAIAAAAGCKFATFAAGQGGN